MCKGDDDGTERTRTNVTSDGEQDDDRIVDKAPPLRPIVAIRSTMDWSDDNGGGGWDVSGSLYTSSNSLHRSC